MSGRLRRAAVALVIVGGIVAIVPGAAGAACAGPSPGDERAFNLAALEQADGAFNGKIVRRRSVGSPDDPDAVSFQNTVTVFRIGRAFKKKHRLLPGDRVRVHSGGSEGLSAKVGSRLGVLLYRDRAGRWTSSLCSQLSRTDLRLAAKDLRAQRR